MQPVRPLRRVVVGVVLVLAAAVGVAAAAGAFGPPALTPAQRAAAARHRLLVAEDRIVKGAASAVDVALPTRPGAGVPVQATSTSLFTVPIRAHEVYGFVPYWELSSLNAADYADVSVLSFYGVGIAGSGRLIRSGPGWYDVNLPSFTSFVASAHAAHDRVLLTVSTTDPRAIARLTSSPASAAARLASEVLPIIRADHLDGLDIDVEGRNAADRSGFVRFVADLTRTLRAADPAGQIMLDTYPQSAGSSSDFFDVAKLAHDVDTIFVMAYDMVDPTASSANSPLASPSLGLSDVGSLSEYVKVVPPAKLVLGLPLYGYDFTTAGTAPGSRALAAPIAVTYASIATIGRTARWDGSSLTPYAVFRSRGHWHQTWFDDPLSIALKTSLAIRLHLGGVGAWALGQEGGATAMLAALDGGGLPVKPSLASP